MSSTPAGAVVMGAGPAGLTAARELRKHGWPVTVVEQDATYVGGIARTVEHHGYRFDIGGHRFFSKNQEIERLWSEILGADLLQRDRLSRIYYRGRFFDYPLRATNALRQLGPVETARCLASYARAQARPVAEPITLEDWVTNQFGHRLFEIFFKTYTEKVWGISTSELSADWAAQRIKGLDMRQVITSALLPGRGPRRGGEIVKTLIDTFRYPRLGPGQLWERVASELTRDGHPVRMGWSVRSIRHREGGVREIGVVAGDGREETIGGSQFVSTLALRDLIRAVEPPPPAAVREAAERLSYRDFLCVALVLDRADVFPDNWIYVHDPGVNVGRLQNFKNWSPDMVADPSRTCLGLEYFCFEGDGLWNSTDEDLVALGARELAALGLAREEDIVDGAVVRQPKAYPVYDATYQEHVRVIRQWLAAAVPNLQVCGRNGMHKYNNQDHSMLTALIVARRIAQVSDLDPWNVNADAEYLEGDLDARNDRSGRRMPSRIR